MIPDGGRNGSVCRLSSKSIRMSLWLQQKAEAVALPTEFRGLHEAMRETFAIDSVENRAEFRGSYEGRCETFRLGGLGCKSNLFTLSVCRPRYEARRKTGAFFLGS